MIRTCKRKLNVRKYKKLNYEDLAKAVAEMGAGTFIQVLGVKKVQNFILY